MTGKVRGIGMDYDALHSPMPVRSYPSCKQLRALNSVMNDFSAIDVKYVGWAQGNSQWEVHLLEEYMLLFTASLNTDGQLPGAGNPYCNILLPAVISVQGFDGWVITFSGCMGDDCSHRDTERSRKERRAASGKRLMHRAECRNTDSKAWMNFYCFLSNIF